MKIIATLGASAALLGIAAPAAAQVGYQTYPQPGYAVPGYAPGYGQQGGLVGVINQLLGNRYQANDRTAITQCAAAAQQQAATQYRPRGNAYGYNQRNVYSMARVTAISDVQRTRNGLRVTGMMDSGMGAYGQQAYNQYGQPVNAASMGDLTFRCNVDYRGAVTNVRINRNRSIYR